MATPTASNDRIFHRHRMRGTLSRVKAKGKRDFSYGAFELAHSKIKNGGTVSRRNWCVTESQHPRIRAATDICHLPG
jgi:hypothetical protein